MYDIRCIHSVTIVCMYTASMLNCHKNPSNFIHIIPADTNFIQSYQSNNNYSQYNDV